MTGLRDGWKSFALMAVTTKTWSFQTTGELQLRPGTSIRQATFSVVVHLSGRRGSSAATPARGPRNCGQFCARSTGSGTAARTQSITHANAKAALMAPLYMAPPSWGGVYPSMSISIADTDAGGNSQPPLAANGFSIVFIASALFKNDNSTIGSSLISNTRPPLMACPAI